MSRPSRQDRIVDAVAVAVALAVGVSLVYVGDATGPSPGVPWPVDVGLGTLACLALWWRRRRPLGVALAAAVLTAVSVMSVGAALVAVYTVAARRRLSTALLVGAANVATVPIYVLQQHEPVYALWVDVLARLVVNAAAIGWGTYAHAQRQLVVSLRERAAHLEAEQHLRVEQAKLTERARIAREMHDVLAHRMSLVSLHAGALEVRTDARPEEVAVAAGVIRTNAHEALQELRTVIGVLRDGTPGAPERPQPGLPDIPELVDSARATGLRVNYTCTVAGAAPTALLGRTAYRIVQEGLTNARKHASGTTVAVLVDASATAGLQVRVTNPAPLRPAHSDIPGAGMGLVGLAERVALAGGRLEYGPGPDGYRLDAWLPWPASAESR